MQRLTVEQIVEETIEYYRTHSRSINPFSAQTECLYNGPNGERCAFSRCCIENAVSKLTENKSAALIIDFHGDEILLPQYRGHNPLFWADLQSLHDINIYWVPNKYGGNDLTIVGSKRVERILVKHAS